MTTGIIDVPPSEAPALGRRSVAPPLWFDAPVMLFEGRRRDLATILAAMRQLELGQSRVILVTGETGIGKSYLARQASDELAANGFEVAWGRADPVERVVPYAAMAQVLTSLEGSVTQLPWRPPSGDAAVLLDVYRPVADLLEAASARGPLVVVIDDLHHADPDTLLLVGFLARRLHAAPIGWLLIARSATSTPVPALVHLKEQLREDGRLSEVVLEPLPPSDIGRLIEQVIGASAEPAVRDAIVERAAGNPLFATQVALTVSETKTGSVLVPSVSRRVALLERIFPLGGMARTVARFAAALGEVDEDTLEGVGERLGIEVDSIREGLDLLVDADLLRTTTSGRYQFAHDLVGEVLYADLGPGERRRIHGAAAMTLLQQRSLGVTVDPVELARHLSLSSVGPDLGAVEALTEAGDALVAVSPRSASERYQQAIQHLPSGSQLGPSLHVRLARSLHRAAAPAEVVKVCRDGLLDATGTERDHLTRYLATALADAGAIGDALEVVDRELATREDSFELHNTRTLFLRLLGDYDSSVESIERSAGLANSAIERLAVLSQRLHLAPDFGAKRAGAHEALQDICQLLPSLDPDSRLLAHVHLDGASIGLGEVRRGTDHQAAAEKLEQNGARIIEWSWNFAPRVVALVRTASWDEAFQQYERGAPEFEAGLRLLVRNAAAIPMLEALRYRADTEALRRHIDDVVDIGAQGSLTADFVRAQLDLAGGNIKSALERLTHVVLGWAYPSVLKVDALYTLLEFGEPPELDVPTTLEELRSVAAANGTVYGRVLRGIAELRHGGDIEVGLAALAEAREHGLVQHEMQLQFELGARGIDPETNLRAGYDAFLAVGASGYTAKAEAKMRRAGVRVPSRRRRDRFALTDAEQRVADLVAEGLTNRAIAERLAYSVNTIETYLSRIYAKTGCANRVELARRVNLYGDPHSQGSPDPLPYGDER